LQDRLAAEFPGRHFPVMMYGPSLVTMIGPDGMGVVVHEGPDTEEEDPE
jgi:SOS-response transcriptional repressor LexA